MNISVEKLDDVNFIVSGTVANSIVEQKVQKLKDEAKKATAEEEVTDEKIEQVAAEEVFREFINEGAKQANINIEELLGQPALKRYEKKEDEIIFEVEIAKGPKIDTDVNIDDIIPSYTKPKADPKAVETKMNEFAAKQGTFSKIETPRALQNDDVAVIDFKGTIDGEAFEGGSAQKFNLKIGSKSFIQGFEEQLIGMEYGETKTITVPFPKEYQAKDLAGKDAQFEVTLHEIQKQIPLALDDELAKKILGDPSATLKSLKGKFEEQVTANEVSDLYMKELKPKIVQGLLTKFDFTLPNNVVEQEIDAKVREQIQHLSQEDQNKLLQDKDKFMGLRGSLRQEAQNSIKNALIVEALAKKEGISADENEARAALTHQAMMSGQDANALVKFYEDNNLMKSVILALVEDKLFGKMLKFHQ